MNTELTTPIKIEIPGICTIESADLYLKDEVDEVISTIRAERDEYRYNLSCARSEIHNMQISMREDIKKIADNDKVIVEKDADYKEICGRLQTANLIKDGCSTRIQRSVYTKMGKNYFFPILVIDNTPTIIYI